VAIHDLMWGCPLCGGEGRLRTRRRVTTCQACGAHFRRADGAAIAAETPDGRTQVRTAAAWLDRAPPPVPPGPSDSLGPERAILRISDGVTAVRPGGVFAGWGERFGPRRAGTATLTPESLVFREDRGALHVWPIDRLTAVQPTSSALQIKARGAPVAYFKFLEGSVRRWEYWIQHRLRSLYGAAGRGDIVEFQPRISTR
jgi:hypothetical protein